MEQHEIRQEKTQKERMEKANSLKRKSAMIGVILLVILNIAAFSLALFTKTEVFRQWYMLCLGGVILIPIVIYAMFLIYKLLSQYGTRQAELEQAFQDKIIQGENQNDK